MTDPIDRIEEICNAQPPGALTMIANVLGFTEERMQELERDAARYRWIRDNAMGGDLDKALFRKSMDGKAWRKGDDMDSAVDAARGVSASDRQSSNARAEKE